MKKIGLTLVLFLGLSIGSYACEAAWENLKYEMDNFGDMDVEDLCEAWEEWVDISC